MAPIADTDTVVERAQAVVGTLDELSDPRLAQIAVDGVCPNPECGNRIVVDVHSDESTITCPACGSDYDFRADA